MRNDKENLIVKLNIGLPYVKCRKTTHPIQN